MISWVHELCKDWGDYMRKPPKAWPEKNHVWRLWKEQGASGSGFGSRSPTWNDNEKVMELHRIWRDMPVELNRFMLTFYVKKAAPKRKAEILGISTTKLYELRDGAHYYVAGRIDEKNSGKTSRAGTTC